MIKLDWLDFIGQNLSTRIGLVGLVKHKIHLFGKLGNTGKLD